jgi:hypothetical protein
MCEVAIDISSDVITTKLLKLEEPGAAAAGGAPTD